MTYRNSDEVFKLKQENEELRSKLATFEKKKEIPKKTTSGYSWEREEGFIFAVFLVVLVAICLISHYNFNLVHSAEETRENLQAVTDRIP